MTRTPAEAVRGLWRTLSDRDYDGVADIAQRLRFPASPGRTLAP